MCEKRIRSWLCVALAVSAWGVTFASTRFLLGDFSPLEILVLRFSIAFAALWLVGRFTGGTDCCGWRNEWIFAAMGLSGIVVYQFLENCAICSMNASSVAIVVAFGPIVTALLARALTSNEQFSARFVCGSLIAVAGVAIVGFEGMHEFSFSPIGMFLAITAMFSWAVYSVLLELANERGVPPLAAVCRAFGWSLAALAPLVAWKAAQSCAYGAGDAAAVVLDAAANAARFGRLANLLNVAFLGFVASAASFVLWSAACRDLGVVRVTASLYLTPIVGVVFAAAFLGEKVTGLEILGGAAILAGIAVATLGVRSVGTCPPCPTREKSVSAKGGVVKLCLAVLVGSVLSCALAQDMLELSFKGSAEVRSAYLSRGKVVDTRPFSAQFADGRLGLWGWGSVGGSVWSVSSFSREGQSTSRRNAYNEADYNLHYDYAFEICDEWALANRLALQWVTLPGYHADMPTRREWHVAQELRNPYVTPYFLLRRAYGPEQWCYWRVGLLRRFALSERLSFVVDGFGELGDSRLFDERYGKARGHFCSGRHAGLNALNIVIGVEYKISDNLKAYASVRQFGLVSDDARAAVKASSAPQAKRDLTIATVGMVVSF